MIIHQDQKKCFCVWQQAPTRRSIEFHQRSTGENSRLLLNFPRILFRIHYNTRPRLQFAGMACGFASLKDSAPKNVYFPILPNIDNELNCCLGYSYTEIGYHDDLESLCKATIGCFWMTPFVAGELDTSIFNNDKFRRKKNFYVSSVLSWWAGKSKDRDWKFPIKSLNKWGKYEDFSQAAQVSS